MFIFKDLSALTALAMCFTGFLLALDRATSQPPHTPSTYPMAATATASPVRLTAPTVTLLSR